MDCKSRIQIKKRILDFTNVSKIYNKKYIFKLRYP